ncbi:hypothetical protein [Planococcus rifietoensis]|uniref:hypothetical protein n=1 Tax=Planococcus rifietoensis TaxID=200991 RepID=UPI00384FE01E
MNLNRTGPSLTRDERNKLNENWGSIENEMLKIGESTNLANLAKLAAEDAQNKSSQAESTASLAVDKVLNLQTQVNSLVVSGDSSPQAIQASIGADGTDYEGNLKARLDAEHDKTIALLAETSNKVKYLSIIDFANPTETTDWTSAFNQAMDYAIENGIKKIVFPDGVFKGNFRVKTPNVKLEGNGWNTILTHDGNTPTLQLQSLEGTSVYDCMISDLMIKHTGTAGGLLIDGRENNFDNIRVDQCNGYGMQILNRLDGASLNKFSNSLFFRNKGRGSVVIPPNDANGYANGNMFSNCSFDRFWSAPAVPTMDIGTSVTIVGGWTQAKNYSGIKVRGAGAYVRLVGHRIDSTDINDVLVEFVDGATLDSLQSVGSDIDGQYALNGVIKHANTMIGTLFTRTENNEIVKYFKDSQHDLTDLGGNRLSGVRIGANRIFWTGSDPVIEFPTRIHYQGDIAIRRNPTDVSTKGYICIASGTPGTWVPLLAKSAYQAGSTAADVAALRTDFNALLTKLRNAGLMANS